MPMLGEMQCEGSSTLMSVNFFGKKVFLHAESAALSATDGWLRGRLFYHCSLVPRRIFPHTSP